MHIRQRTEDGGRRARGLDDAVMGNDRDMLWKRMRAVLMVYEVVSAVNVDAARSGRRFLRLSALNLLLVMPARNSRRSMQALASSRST
jgi:hypothetical protein